MPSGSRFAKLSALACAVLVCALAPAAAAAAPLSIKVDGNHFVNGDGQTVRLLGVNHPSFEYTCQQGNGYSDGHMDDADAVAIASWNASAVRIPLNEDCWLGTNGLPLNNGGSPQPLTAAGYQQAVRDYVNALGAHGLYAILDLHWTVPGGPVTEGQRPMPDSKSTTFWSSVASTFKDNPAVVFDLFNEPYSPAEVNDPAHPVSWNCWRNGGCQVPVSSDLEPASKTLYTAVGMQALVDAVRGTGATQPLLVGGLDYANDLTQWLANKPSDPLNQIAASFHNYQGKTCDNAGCWNSTIASVAAQAPVVTGEFAEDICAPNNFDEEYMTWSDQHGVGYLAWGWWVLTPQEIADAGCSAYFLLTDYNGTPAAPNGTALHDHLLKLPPRGLTQSSTPPPAAAGTGTKKSPIRLTTFRGRVKPGGTQVSFELRSAENCSGLLSGKTARSFALASARPKRHKVSLGSVSFALKAGKPKTVVLKLSPPAKQLLAAKRKLKASFTITLTSAANGSTVLQRSLRLKLPPAPRRHGR